MNKVLPVHYSTSAQGEGDGGTREIRISVGDNMLKRDARHALNGNP